MKEKLFGSKWKVLSLTLVATIMFMTGCTGASNETATNTKGSNSEETIKIGLLLSQTGTFAPLSEGIKNGFELYLAEHDNMLGGKKVTLKYEDDEANPQVALRKYRQLVHSEKVNILVGPISSAVVYALRDEVEKDKIVLIDANAAADDLSWSKKSDYVYRTSWSNWQNGGSTATYLAENVGKTAIAIAPDFPAGKEVAHAFKVAFEAAGGKVIKEIYPKLGTNDFATYLTEVANDKPDLVYAFAAGSDGIRFVQQYKDFGLQGKIPLAGPLEFGDQLIVEPSGDAAEGIISGVPYSPWLENESNKKFVDEFQKKYNKLPNTYAVSGYDSATVIDKAMTKAGSAKSENLIKVLKGISFDSPRGPITIDPKTNNPIQNFYITKNTKKNNQMIPEVMKTVEKFTMPETAPAK